MASRHRRHRKNRALRIVLCILGAIIFVVLVAGASAWYLWSHSAVLNKKMFTPKQSIDIGEPQPSPSPTLPLEQAGSSAPAEYDMYYDGTYYKLRENVVSVLFMGIDSKKNQATDSEIVSTANQADTLLLGVFDTENGRVRVLHIPRDTLADVKVLDMTKKYVATERKHICLQHVYGDGGEMSCELMMDAVSNLLFGAPVYRYVSLGMNGVEKAVNTVGGVELTMLEDFSFYSSSMKKDKTVKLNGKRALVYIRSRESMRGDKTDANRRARQIQFLQAFIARVKEKSKENPALVLSVYDSVKDYLQTNLTLEELLFVANQGIAAGLNDGNLINLPGTVGDEEQPYYYMDDDAARKIVLELFYQEVVS